MAWYQCTPIILEWRDTHRHTITPSQHIIYQHTLLFLWHTTGTYRHCLIYVNVKTLSIGQSSLKKTQSVLCILVSSSHVKTQSIWEKHNHAIILCVLVDSNSELCQQSRVLMKITVSVMHSSGFDIDTLATSQHTWEKHNHNSSRHKLRILALAQGTCVKHWWQLTYLCVWLYRHISECASCLLSL